MPGGATFLVGFTSHGGVFADVSDWCHYREFRRYARTETTGASAPPYDLTAVDDIAVSETLASLRWTVLSGGRAPQGGVRLQQAYQWLSPQRAPAEGACLFLEPTPMAANKVLEMVATPREPVVFTTAGLAPGQGRITRQPPAVGLSTQQAHSGAAPADYPWLAAYLRSPWFACAGPTSAVQGVWIAPAVARLALASPRQGYWLATAQCVWGATATVLVSEAPDGTTTMRSVLSLPHASSETGSGTLWTLDADGDGVDELLWTLPTELGTRLMLLKAGSMGTDAARLTELASTAYEVP